MAGQQAGDDGMHHEYECNVTFRRMFHFFSLFATRSRGHFGLD